MAGTRAQRRADRGRIQVDVGAVFDLVGGLLKWVGLAFLAPAVVALFAHEPAWPFLVGGVATTATGLLLDRITHDRDEGLIGPREGLMVVAMIWLLVPLFGAIPFLVGSVPGLGRPVDAYFESVSGFTATGATVLKDIEHIGDAMQFWRQLSHWLGGMGIIVLAVAILPRLRIGGRQLLQTELAGPTEIEKLSATIRETARRLWTLYLSLTLVFTAILAVIGWTGLDPAMDVFQAFSHASSAMALGGFSPKNQSVAAFAPITQWVLCLVMLIAGVNFLRLHRLFVRREVKFLAHDEEIRLYFAFLAVGALLLLAELWGDGIAGGESAVRLATFQAVSVMTTTGFATGDWTLWGPLATMTLLLLMFIGASAGSTGGAIKVVRHLLLFRIVRRELVQTTHRSAVVPVRVNGIAVDEKALRSAIVFVLLYLVIFALGSLGLVIDADRTGSELTVFEAIGASASCIGNVGPAFGVAGPFGNYSSFSDLSTWILSMLMWLGRVEIIPVVVLLTRSFWKA